ncbi:MAG: hypothetical protein JSV29_02715, partial [Candidatus Bathyarchaeota archaeon]
MLRKQKENFSLLSIFAVLGILMFTTKAQADLDIEYISITSCIDYIDGTLQDSEPWSLDIVVKTVDSGSRHYIDVTPPNPATQFTIYEDNVDKGKWDWDSRPEDSSLANLRARYPEGDYIFEFCEIDGTILRTVVLDYSDLPSVPANPIDYTYPATYGTTGIPINPTITWTVNSSDGDTLMMALDDDLTGEDVYWAAPISITTTSLTPGPLLPGRLYVLDLSVVNVKDLESGPALPTMNVDGDELQYSLGIAYLNGMAFTTAEPGKYSLREYYPLAEGITWNYLQNYQDGRKDYEIFCVGGTETINDETINRQWEFDSGELAYASDIFYTCFAWTKEGLKVYKWACSDGSYTSYNPPSIRLPNWIQFGENFSQTTTTTEYYTGGNPVNSFTTSME